MERSASDGTVDALAVQAAREQAPTAHPAEADGLTGPRLYWAVLSVALAICLTVVDGSMVNVALPDIARDLGLRPSEAIWIVNANQLAVVVSLLPMAALGEIIGYRRIYLIGLTLFTCAALASALSDTLVMLAASRMLQGFGAAAVMAVNGALLRIIYPHRMLGRGIGVNAMVVSSCSAAGPTIAAAILAVAPWHWLFGVSLPLGLAAATVAALALPGSATVKRRFDWFAALLNAGAFGLIIAGVDLATRTSAKVMGTLSIVGGVAVGALLIWREWREPRPLVPIDLLRDKTFALSISTSVASFGAQMLALVCLPFLFLHALGRSPVETGLLLTPWPVAVALMAPVSGWLADRYSTPKLCAAGLVVFALGLASLALISPHAAPLDIGARMVVCGVGFGLFQSPNNRLMLTSAPRDRAGAAGGMLATARVTGQTVGALLTAILLHLLGNDGERIALGAAAAFAIAGAAVSLLRLGTPTNPPGVLRPVRA